MCPEEFKLAGEDLPFLCWGNDFLASLYNQGRINCVCVRGVTKKKKECVCLFVWLRQSLSLFLLLIHRAYKSLGAAKLNLSMACVLSECIGDRCVYWWEHTNTLKLKKNNNSHWVIYLLCSICHVVLKRHHNDYPTQSNHKWKRNWPLSFLINQLTNFNWYFNSNLRNSL